MGNYFPNNYKIDLNTQRELKKECTCGRVVNSFLTSEEPLLIDIRQFYIYNFFLNLFNEVIIKHFPEHAQSWQEQSLGFIYYKCTYENKILAWTRFLRGKEYNNETISLRSKDYMIPMIIFLKYVDEILDDTKFDGLDSGMIRTAISHDDNYVEMIRLMVSDESLSAHMKYI